MVNVGKHTIHRSYGYGIDQKKKKTKISCPQPSWIAHKSTYKYNDKGTIRLGSTYLFSWSGDMFIWCPSPNLVNKYEQQKHINKSLPNQTTKWFCCLLSGKNFSWDCTVSWKCERSRKVLDIPNQLENLKGQNLRYSLCSQTTWDVFTSWQLLCVPWHTLDPLPTL